MTAPLPSASPDDPTREGPSGVRDALAVVLCVCAPLLVVAVAGGLALGAHAVLENGYLAQERAHAAARLLWRSVGAELAVALAAGGLAAAGALLLRRWSSVAFAIPALYAAPLALLAHRLLDAQEWSVIRYRHGLPLPGTGLRGLAAGLLAVAALAALLGFLWSRRRRRAQGRARWPSRRATRGSAAAAGAALALAAAVALLPRLVPPTPTARPYDLVWITWDSTRADRLSSYGHARPTTPEVDRFAAGALLFETAITQHNWTRPSYASMLTSRHGWELPAQRLEPSALTLPEVLQDHGYTTVAYVQNPNLDAQLAFDQGFERYAHLSEFAPPAEMAERVVSALRDLAAGREPFFLFAHFQGPHYPYRDETRFADRFVRAEEAPLEPAEILRLMVEHGEGWSAERPGAQAELRYLRDLYDSSLRETDAAFGTVATALRELGLLERAVVLFNSDHGDEFGDRGGFGHAHANLHPELTFSPLVLSAPPALGAASGRVAAPVQMLDVAPTLLELIGAAPPASFTGRSLWPVEGIPTERIAASSVGSRLLLRGPRLALLVDPEDPEAGERWFDRRADPDERTPLAPGAASGPEARRLREEAARRAEWLRGEAAERARAPAEVDPALREALRALGYAP